MTLAPLLLISNLLAAAPNDAAAIRHFERRIRPLLIRHCVSCHGPKKQESSLRVDSRAALVRGGDRGPAINLKQPDKSLLLQAIVGEGDLKMPPKRKLKANVIADFKRWLQAGAKWPAEKTSSGNSRQADKHWAFQPIARPKPPQTASADNPIDAFVLKQLAKRKLRLSPPAEKRELIRRLSFNLTGLPPRPQEVANFLADRSPHAYEKLVERLLASPQYGERWARHWLDVARYADNRGYVFFIGQNFAWSYTYRDYVIRSFNQDLSYDQFVKQQLAADLLKSKDRSSLAGMGFLTIGAHFMNNIHDITDDRIDVISRGLMALTVSCARCHDHKFDPIPQADYYSLYGVMRTSVEPTIPPLLTKPPTTTAYKKFDAELRKRNGVLQKYIQQRYKVLVSGARRRVNEYLMAVFRQQDQPDQDDFMLLVNTNEVNPTMVIRWRHYLRKLSDEDPVFAPWLSMRRVSASDFASEITAVAKKLKGKLNPLVQQHVLATAPKSISDLADRYGKLFASIADKWQRMKKANSAAQMSAAEEQLRQHIFGKNAPATVPVISGWGFLTIFPDRATQGEFKKRFKAVEDWIERGPGAPPRAMSLVDSKVEYQPRIFLRGNSHRAGKEVPRQFLQLLSPKRQPYEKGSGRLKLAEAIVSPKNPLTARVIVNRVWQHHFGQGLVTTPSDFGLRSSPPSHPLLLDYLARYLIDHDWSIKSLHRLILVSAVYKQSSRFDERSFQIDPSNRLLWRFNRRRLDFESLRDALLVVADELDFKLGGKAMALHAQNKVVPRRSIYGFINRMDVSPLMTTFDFPNPVATSPGRVTTTVAPQALYFMNNPFVRTISQRMAKRLPKKSPPAAINQLYAKLFSRPATKEELALAQQLLGSKPKDTDWTKLIQALLMTNEFVFVD